MLKGHLLNERYRIKNTIGSGGMADVYLARDIILDRDVAIKVLRLEYAHDEEFIARFDREAQNATSLSHPNIVSIYDVGEEDQILFMAMEYVDGMTLKEYIQKYGPIDVPVAIDIMKQIASAIAHAHENGIVHRDIKPQNILIDTYGHIKVTGFGIAMALSATSLTQTNSVLGSVHYLSPEQARGGLATKKSDIYSLGIVFFELLTGRLPFSGQSPVSIALKHLQSDTPSVRRFNQDVPQSVENIVLRATTKDPFHRFNTVYEMEASLETALDPSKLNEKRYNPPSEVGEQTKAIPVITDSQLHDHEHQDTIVHQTNGDTKKVPPGQTEGTNHVQNQNKKKKRKKKWLITSIILFILLASGIAALFIIPGIMQPKEVTIPNVIELEYEDAVEELESLNLRVEKEEIYSEDIEEGLVVKTDPRAGRPALEESTVTVFVSQGKEKETLDDYVGRDFNQIRRLLEQKGYKEVIPYEEHSDRPEGEIIAQIQPTPDSQVVPSGTTVIFEVSIGPELVDLESLEGYTEEEAKEYLESNGLKMNAITENSEDVPEGQVIRHSPDAGAELEPGSTVNVYVSIGPEALPPRSTTIYFTVPYKEPDAEGNPDDDGAQGEAEREEQMVIIYVEDANRNMEDVAIQDSILEDTEYKINLIINPGETGAYRVTRDGEEIFNETVPYED